jgi:hypothetical protein
MTINNRYIQLDIKPDGSGFALKPVNFIGPLCLKATKKLEGIGTVDERDRQLTEEYYQVVEQEQELLQPQQTGL